MSATYIIPFCIAIFAIISILLLWKRLAKTKALLSSTEHEKSELVQNEHSILDFLHHLGLSIDRERSPHKVYKIIVEGVKNVTKASGCTLYLFDKKNQYLVPAFISNHCPPLISRPHGDSHQAIESHFRLTKVNRNEGLMGLCLQKGRSLCIENIRLHPDLQDEFSNYEFDTSAMIAPLRHGGKEIGVLVVARSKERPPFKENNLFTFSSVAEQSAFAIGNSYAHHEAAEKKRLDAELMTAQEVQRVLLPNDDPRVPGYRIHGHNIPARIISGDYYDYLQVSAQSSGVMIADVSGKGVPAGIIMATFRSCLRSLSSMFQSPSETLKNANKQIYSDMREDMFISAAYVHIQHNSGELKIARAGHNPPYYYTALTDCVEKLKPPGLAVGIDEGDVFSRVIKDHELCMKSGDCLLLYTDGIIEATNKDGEEFGAKRLEETFKQSVHGGAEILVKSVLKKLQLYSKQASQADDITLVAIEKE